MQHITTLSGDAKYHLATKSEFQALVAGRNYNPSHSEEVNRTELEALKKRAKQYYNYKFVLYDPYDNSQGFMIWGDDPNELVRELHNHH